MKQQQQHLGVLDVAAREGAGEYRDGEWDSNRRDASLS